MSNFLKYADGLIPAIVQDVNTKMVLMLGFMNEEALKITIESGKVTFYSRSKKRIWTKGEESGNYLKFISMEEDCDQDTFLIQAEPTGPVCHTGTDTCFNQKNNKDILQDLEDLINQRKNNNVKDSYVSSLFEKGINKIAQKVGEEAVELVIEAKDEKDELFLNEAADLLFHYMILLRAKGYSLADVKTILQSRKK